MSRRKAAAAPALVPHPGRLAPGRREERLGQKGCVVWFTGLSGSGKSTLARGVESALVSSRRPAAVLDGDAVRLGLNKDLGFSAADRTENIRRVGEVAKLFADNNVIVLAAFISPFRRDRDLVRRLLPAGRFFEVHCAASLETCEGRDVKGLYKRARAGELRDFTGISSPYEPPARPELVVDSGREGVREAVLRVISLLRRGGILARGRAAARRP